MTDAPRAAAALLAALALAAGLPAAPPAATAEAAQAPAAGGTLVIAVGNVRAAKGHVRVDVCPQARFLKSDCPYSGSAPAVKGTTTVVVRGLAPGRYAVQAYLDENDNREVDRAILGIPREGIGFSNGVKIRFSAPKFADAAFDFPGGEQAIRLSLQYFL